MNSILSALKGFEELLTNKASGNWLEIVSGLISDDFTEVGSSGRIYDKQQVLKELSSAPVQNITRNDFKLKRISDDTFLLKYIAIKNLPDGQLKSYRSSVWKLSDGRWQIMFHQGTKIE